MSKRGRGDSAREAPDQRTGAESGLRTTLANPQQRWMLAGLATAAGGTWLITTALSIQVVAVAGSSGVALLSLRFLAPALAGPFAAIPAMRLAPRTALLAVGVGRTLALSLAVVALASGAPLWILVALAGLDGAIAAAARPAAATAGVAVARSPAELAGASTLASNVKTIAAVAGAVLGGFLTAALAVEVVFAAGTALLALSTLAALPLRVPSIAKQPARARRKLRRGDAEAVADNVDLRVVIAGAATRSMVRAAWVALAVLAATGYLGMGEAGVGTLSAAAGAGAICSVAFDGALIASDRLAELLRRSLVVFGAALALVALFASPLVAVAAIAIWGLAAALVDMSASATLPRVAGGPQLARTIALTEAMKESAEGIALAIVPLTVALFGVRGGIVAWAALPLLLALASGTKLRDVDEVARRTTHLLERVRGVAPFASLRVVELSRIAGLLRERAVGAGEVVVREGEPADGCYFIVDDGELEVSVVGHAVRTIAAGTGFGEIALLHDVPRTATVTALEDARVLELSREDFLRALTDAHAGAWALQRAHGAPPAAVDLATALASSPLLFGLSAAVCGRLAAAALVRDLRDGELVCAIGEEAPTLIVVLSGAVLVAPAGDVEPVRLGGGETLGEISLMHDVPRTADVRTVGTTRIAEIAREAISRELERADADLGRPILSG